MGRVIGPPPLTEPWGAYFFFLVAFLAAFFLAGILVIPPFGPEMDGQPLVNISGDEGLDILAVG
jgi:hypothetical protein